MRAQGSVIFFAGRNQQATQASGSEVTTIPTLDACAGFGSLIGSLARIMFVVERSGSAGVIREREREKEREREREREG